MPSDDYASTVRGSLKLKGSKPDGIKKKKKKPRTTTDTEASSENKKSVLQQALEDEDAEGSKDVVKGKRMGDGEEGAEELDEEKLRELDPRGGDGKTASERAYEEMRRKRVCCSLSSFALELVLILWGIAE
jgi:protein FAM32A